MNDKELAAEFTKVRDKITRKGSQKAKEVRAHVDERIDSVEQRLNSIETGGEEDLRHTEKHLEGIVHQKGTWVIIAVVLIVAVSVVINIVAN